MEPSDVVASLSSPWRAAFEQAWTSFLEGNFGIGAALFRPDDLTVVAEGRNLVGSARPAAQPLAGNFMAHAEMNAFASLESFTARGLHLVTTLEPCLMCGATAIFMNVDRVDYAASDEFYQGFGEDLWPAHPYTRDRQPETNHAFRGPLAAFARLLPRPRRPVP